MATTDGLILGPVVSLEHASRTKAAVKMHVSLSGHADQKQKLRLDSSGRDIVIVMAFPRINGLRAMEMGTPGAFRDQLNALIVSGAKTTTTGLLHFDYEIEEEEVEKVGERMALVDNDNRQIAEIEILAAEVMPLSDVSVDHAVKEGEGWTDVETWKSDHQRYWKRVLNAEVSDDTEVVCLEFRVVDAH